MNEVEIVVKGKDQSGPEMEKAEGRIHKLKETSAKAGVAMAAGGAVAGGLFAKGLVDNINIEASSAKLAGQLNLTKSESAAIGKVSGEVYADNWGESVDDVNLAIKSVGNNIGDVSKMSASSLKEVTEGALALSSTFDVDVNDSTRAAGKLMKSGLAKDSKAAFDMITTGFQGGLDASGDFLDTLNEYSPQFSKLGFTGKDTLDILSAGMKAGARDTDAIADAFKEFSIRSIDGSKTTADGFKSLGMSAKDTAAQIGKGGDEAESATMRTVQALVKVKDPIEQNRIGTELFGTQWEDTVRKILPALANFEGAAGDVDGATQKMADTVGGTAAGKIETMKRKFEQWTQGMAASHGQMGLAVAGLNEFGGGAAQAGSQVAMMAVAMKGLNLSFLANPMVLITAAIIALAAAFVVAYKKSETFRDIINQIASSVASIVLGMVILFLKYMKMMTDTWMDAASIFINGAAKAFGWVPGIGGKLKGAAKEFDKFKNQVSDTLDGAIEKTQDWKRATDRMPKVIKLKGEISDLNSKINTAKARLKEKGLTDPQRSALRADISQLQAQVRVAKATLASVQSKTVTVRVNTLYEINKGYAGNAATGGRAHGGIIGAAGGGPRGGRVLVGENGPEFADFPLGTMVHPAGTTRSMMGQGGGVSVVRLEISSSGSAVDQMLLEILRRAIRVRGGDVQLVLGR